MTEIEDFENQAMQPDFWDDMAASQAVLQKTKQLKDKVASYEGLYSSWEDALVMIELASSFDWNPYLAISSFCFATFVSLYTSSASA